MDLIRCTFISSLTSASKKKLYLCLDFPHLTYWSSVWRLSLIKDNVALERIQKRVTKYIMGQSLPCFCWFKARLLKLNILPLMYILELDDVLFFILVLSPLTYASSNGLFIN